MDASADQRNEAAERETLRLRQLLPPGEPATAAQIIEALGLWERADDRSPYPRLLLNMVTTTDGRATIEGRSGPLSGPADRALFHALRTAVDGVLVGAGTVRTERYGRLIPEQSQRALRRERGLSEEPLACIVSGRLALDTDIPLLAEPAARVVIVTSSAASLPEAGAQIEYVRSEQDGHLDLAQAMRVLRDCHGVRTLLCEGGPHLCSQLLAAGLVHELFLSISPLLAGGEPTGGEALRILAGPEPEEPVELALLSAQLDRSSLFLRYAVDSRETRPRETIPSSSLAN